LFDLTIALLMLWSSAISMAVAAEPAANSPPAKSPRTFEVQLVGPDGKPVPHAEVGFRNTPVPTRQQVKVGEFVKANKYSARIRTDAAGKFVVELPKIASYFVVDIEVPGFAPYWAEWRSDENAEQVPPQLVAELDAGWSVGGIVVDSEGKPVKGATVHPSIKFKKRPGDEGELYVGGEVKTDDDGRWHFDSVPAAMNAVSVSIKHPQLMPATQNLTRADFGLEAGKQPTAKIELKPGIVITGHVTDEAGKPIAGARVFTREREAKTDADGAYRLAGLGPGKLRLVLTAEHRAMDMKDLMVEPDMEPVDFVTKPGGKIRVRVLDKNGQPIPKARVFFQRWGGRQIEYFEFDKIKQYSDKDGVWEWDGAPLEPLEADICPPGGMQLARQNITAREEEYVFHPLEALVISGTVTDAKTKEPIKSFRVIPGNRYGQNQLFWNRREAYTAKDGKYQIRDNRVEGARVIRVEADGYKPSESEDIKAEDETVVLDFELERGADIEGTVLTPDGKPAAGAKLAMGIAGAQIYVRNGDVGDSSTYAARVATDKAGKFHFPPQDNAFTLVVTHPSGFARLSSGAEWKQDAIKLEPWARVEGTFQVGKKLAPNVTLEIQTNDFNRFGNEGPRIFSDMQATTDGSGHFVFERVLPGKGYIGRRMIFMMNEGATEVTSSRRVHFACKAGDQLKLNLGGDGRQAVGRLLPPKGAAVPVNWRMVRITLQAELAQQPKMPQPPAAVQNDRQKFAAWLNEWQQSPEGKAWRAIGEANNRIRETMSYFNASPDKDGNFTIDDVPPGSYQLSAYLDQGRGMQRPANHHISVPAAEGELTDTPVDVGDIPLGGA
jgi:protocatechuate 3,4-dioxygenase beta subunit